MLDQTASDRGGDEPDFIVVINIEEQYSVWPVNRAIPDGWQPLDGPRPKAECLNQIATAWTDMRPLSLRRAVDGA